MMNNLKSLLLFSIPLIIFSTKIYAAMPEVFCESICSNIHSKQSVPIGGRCIKQDRQRIYYRTLGKGRPTMIFASGTGFPADGWFDANIATKMAEKIAVFSYDRIYTFNSCPNKNNYMPVTARDVVAQLHQLLQNENIKPPYILVGHSFGGLYMLLYAKLFPNEVVGLVLMDASSDAGPTPLSAEAKMILQKRGNPQNPIPENPLYNEMIGQLPSYLQTKSAKALLNNMPLIVMYTTKHCLPKVWTKKLMCMTAAQELAHKNKQIEMYNMSNVHKLIIVDGDHMSFFDADKNAIMMHALNTILLMAQAK
jgi:pimeloyl-ACP methyl ester carboxylesterase